MTAKKVVKKSEVGKTRVTILLQNKEQVRNLFQGSGNSDQKWKFPKDEGHAKGQFVPKTRIVDHFENNKLWNNFQHDFRTRISIITALSGAWIPLESNIVVL